MTAGTIEERRYIRNKYSVKGRNNTLLVQRILQTMKGYRRLTIRQTYYILISRFEYPATRDFYKRLDRYLSKIRRENPEVHMKFIDPTRRFFIPPLPYCRTEIWVEKDSVRIFMGKLPAKYRLGIQILRGFASLSMFRRALERARKRGVTTVLYIGDFDPSGLLIESVAQEEMNHKTGIKFVRLALTMQQINRFKPPSRPVNLKDSRAKEYIEKYGDRCWEVEALRPRTLYRLIERGLKEGVPPKFLAEAENREKVALLAKPLAERLRKTIETDVSLLLEAGVPEAEVTARVSEKYDVKLRGG